MKWMWRIAGAVLGLLVIAVAALFGASQWALARDRDVPLTPIVADTSPAGIAEGARLAKIEGCMSCHAGGHGRTFIDDPKVARFGAPAFAAFVPHESDAQIARSIRQGVSGDGRQLFIMPSHRYLADDDTARLIGYLRTLRPSPQDLPVQRRFGPIGRVLVLKGAIRETAHPPLLGGPHRWADTGAYFVHVTCMGCHDLYTSGEVDGETVPPLAPMAAGYDDAAFLHLLRTGQGLGKPDLGLMSEVAKGGFAHFTEAEIAAIHAYLKAQAEKMPGA